ncbi:MAG: hypothetical protein QGH94_00240 [Phycisphaerae bacterium]|jgi:hypothetical protein|nr:hypothetical protein [Phycisphaerae bacterium]
MSGQFKMFGKSALLVIAGGVLFLNAPLQADITYTDFDGAETIDLDPGSDEIVIDGKNKLGMDIHDFTLELKGVDGKVKIKRVKVMPADRRGNLKSTSDWDVDDNMDGNTQGDSEKGNIGSGFSNDKNAPGGRANEADNVDDSPGQKTRVDSSGFGQVSCCGGAGYGKAPDHAEQQAIKNKTEDSDESYSDDRVSKSEKRGRNKFRIKIKLTGKLKPAKKGGKCQIVVTPSTEGHKTAMYVPDGLQPGGGFVGIGFIHPAPGVRLMVPNNTGHTLVAVKVKPKGGINVVELSEIDPVTEAPLVGCNLEKDTTDGVHSLTLDEPVAPGGKVCIDAAIAHFEPQGAGSGLELTPVIDDSKASTAWPPVKGVLVTFIPSGRNYGNIGDLVLTNTTDKTVSVTVPEGLLLDSNDPKVQDLYVARVPTEQVCQGAEDIGKVIPIKAGKAYVVRDITGFCPDFELASPGKGESGIYVAKKPDKKSETLLATIELARKVDVGEMKLEVFGKKKTEAMITQGALWMVDSKCDSVEQNDVTKKALEDKFLTVFKVSAKGALAKMDERQKKKAVQFVEADVKDIVAKISFVSKTALKNGYRQ